MNDIKGMYKKIVKDNFPDTVKIDLGGQVLVYKKKVWNIFDADEKCDVERGLRYGEILTNLRRYTSLSTETLSLAT